MQARGERTEIEECVAYVRGELTFYKISMSRVESALVKHCLRRAQHHMERSTDDSDELHQIVKELHQSVNLIFAYVEARNWYQNVMKRLSEDPIVTEEIADRHKALDTFVSPTLSTAEDE